MVDWQPLAALGDAPRFEWLQAERLGTDLRLRLKRVDDDFWHPQTLSSP
jgi:hypothetical protein